MPIFLFKNWFYFYIYTYFSNFEENTTYDHEEEVLCYGD